MRADMGDDAKASLVTVIETPRLRLRRLVLADLDALAAMFADPEVMPYIGKGGVLDRDAARRTIEHQIQQYETLGYGEWATDLRETGEMVGLCGLILWPDIEGVAEIEVAYLLARDAWGLGLGTEVAAAIRDWTRAELDRTRLVSCIYPANVASIRVAQKIGMRHEKDFDYEGSPMALYSMGPPAVIDIEP
jgi:ribosomal-protein-alanine N-acetyltransferase